MLLEAYEEYAKHAQLVTSIYASSGSAKDPAAAKAKPAKKQVQKKRKKNLKRL